MILVDVVIAGPEGGGISLLLKKFNSDYSDYEPWEPGGDDQCWFTANGPNKDEILATALAAITAGKRVFVNDIKPGDPINAMRLTPHLTRYVSTLK